MAWKLKDLFSRKPDAPQVDADAWFKRGNAHATQMQWQPALDCFREATRLEPSHSQAHAYVGNVLRILGQPVAALEAYDRAIALNPNFAEAHYNRGALLRQAGQPAMALDSYDLAISANPVFTEAHSSRGDVLNELGRPELALASYEAAVKINGDYAAAHLNKGIVQQQLQRSAAAEESYRRAIVLKPDYADAYFNLGSLQSNAGNYTDALASFNAAIAVGAGHAGAHGGRGLALMALGQPGAAVLSFDEAVRLKPDFARVFSNRAQAQAKLGRTAEARVSHAQAVLLDPQDAAIHFNRGGFFSDLKEWREASESYRTALKLKPDYAEAHCNLGLVQQDMGQADAAMESYAQALAINPGLATAYNNRGNLFRSRRQFELALSDYRQAIVLEPNSAEGHYNIGQVALLQAHFSTGWPQYEWRRLIAEALAVQLRTLPQPGWFGEFPISGKSIFLYAEQGLGDTIQFCRYVGMVAQLGASVTLEVQSALADLVADLEGVSHLIVAGAPIPSTDYKCSLMSLPGAFKTTLETIPNQVPYLRPDAVKVARWREVLGPGTRPRIGLAWSGNPGHSENAKRSLALSEWIAHLPTEFDYFCLQKEVSEPDRQTLSSYGRILTVEAYDKDLSDTAALIETLDLVITVDTSIAHLSGALGKETWILLAYLPDWRWLLDRSDSPWYPTAKLYRQVHPGDWRSVVAEVQKDLLLRHPR